MSTLLTKMNKCYTLVHSIGDLLIIGDLLSIV